MNSVPFVVAIPARFAASRLPGKPLRRLSGGPRVVDSAGRGLAAGGQEVWVAADDARTADALTGVPVRVAMTSAAHASGTDRIAECARQAGWPADTIVVNLQGDEPFAPAEGIRRVAELLSGSDAPMATLAAPIDDASTLFDPNAVKVVCDALGHALYFTRAPVPWARDAFAHDRDVLPPAQTDSNLWLRHIGIYAYRAGFLQTFTGLPPGRLEALESLEQLRVLEAGHRIAVAVTPAPFPPGVDTPEDLVRAQARLDAAG